MSSLKLEWTTSRRKVTDLIPHDKNPRKMSTGQMEQLKKSLEKFNIVEIPAIDTDNKIIAGHQRLKALQILGRGNEEIDVRVPNRKLTKEEYDQYLIASNAVTGDWDYSLLKDFDLDMLSNTGFDSDELANIWDDNTEVKEETFDEKEELAKIKEATTKVGDLIELGEHRLICGDSTDGKTIKRLCGEHKVSMIYSDPPYNINLDYNKGLGGQQEYGADVTDNRSEVEYIDFLRRTMSAALSATHPDCHVFYWNTEQHIWIVQTLFKELGIRNKRVCLWVKNCQNPTPQVAFSKVYEPCIYGTIGSPYLSKKEQGLNEILNSEVSTGNDVLDELTNIWTMKRLSSVEYSHATSKPPELHKKAILRCTKPGDIILDSFGGSGSTLVAGHQLKRKVFLVEKEPVFCDLIIRRFEKLTGVKAKITNLYEKA